MQTDTLAVDFGTSNSAAAIPTNNGVRRILIEGQAETLPTAVFFPPGGQMRIGAAATEALIAGEAGRYMRSLKSVLGLPLLHEARPIGGRSRTIAEIITDFLAAVRDRAEAATGFQFRRAVAGRPVRFHSDEPEKDAKAEDDLRTCYLAAGFEAVEFLAEPEAAAIANHGMGAANAIGLIVDIGGGTSDFSVFRGAGGRPEILASHGVRLGGTDFDHAISMTHAMPALGLGGEMRREMGGGLLPVPRAPYVDLATWAKIPFLYAPETRRAASKIVRLAVEPEKVRRYAGVLEQELGHDLAFAVEQGKISANAEGEAAMIDMGFIESGLAAKASGSSLGAALAPHRAALRDAMSKTLERADVDADSVGRVILVGGSSLMRMVSDEARDVCPNADILQSEAFTAVVDGLALAARSE